MEHHQGPGIYAVRHLASGKVYVGSAVNVAHRLYNHTWHLSRGTHKNAHLQSAWRKYGDVAFALELLEAVPRATDLISREQVWIDLFDACNRTAGYNACPVAGSVLGRILGPVARANMATAARAAMADPDTKARHKLATAEALRQPGVAERISESALQKWADPVKRAALLERIHSPAATAKRTAKCRATKAPTRAAQHAQMEIRRLQRFHTTADKPSTLYRVFWADGRIEIVGNLKDFCAEHGFIYQVATSSQRRLSRLLDPKYWKVRRVSYGSVAVLTWAEAAAEGYVRTSQCG